MIRSTHNFTEHLADWTKRTISRVSEMSTFVFLKFKLINFLIGCCTHDKSSCQFNKKKGS